MYIVQTTATHSVTAVRLCTVVKSLQETDNLHELDKRKTWLCSDIGRLTLMTFPERKAFRFLIRYPLITVITQRCEDLANTFLCLNSNDDDDGDDGLFF